MTALIPAPRQQRRKRKSTVDHSLEADCLKEQIRVVAEAGLVAAVTQESNVAQQYDLSNAAFSALEAEQPWSDRAWRDERWMRWEFEPAESNARLRLGSVVDPLSDVDLKVAASIPFIESGQPLVITSTDVLGHAAATALVRSVVFRLAVSAGSEATFSLFDPTGRTLGHLPELPRSSVHLDQRCDSLEAITDAIHDIASNYLDSDHPTFAALPPDVQRQLGAHFVIVTDFPASYDGPMVEALANIASIGPRAGVYLVVHTDQQAVNAPQAIPFANPIVLNCSLPEADFGGIRTTIALDSAPSIEIQHTLIEKLAAGPRRDPELPRQHAVPSSPARWWQDSSARYLAARIGQTAAGDSLELRLGDQGGVDGASAHAIIAGNNAADRWALFDLAVADLSTRYGETELRFHLLACRCCNELSRYQSLPHVALISNNTTVTTTSSILDDLATEAERRLELFGRLNASGFAVYRAMNGPASALPRLVVGIDDIEHLIGADRDGHGATQLIRLLKVGARTGIHVVLGMSSYTASSLERRSDILSHIDLRIAMQLDPVEVARLGELGVGGRRLVATHCDRPGRLVASAGADREQGAFAGRLFTWSRTDSEAFIAKVVDHAREFGIANQPAVLDGLDTPRFATAPTVRCLVLNGEWPRVDQFVRAAHQTDLDSDTTVWRVGERPVPLLLGQAPNHDEHAMAVIRRRPANHLLIVSADAHTRVGMIASATMSLALMTPPDQLSVVMCNRGTTHAGWSKTLDHTCTLLQQIGVDVTTAHRADDADVAVMKLAELVRSRRALPEREQLNQPTVLVVLNEPDRIPLLVRSRATGVFTGPTHPDLDQLLQFGSEVGVHVVLAAPTLNMIRAVIDRTTFDRAIRFRVATRVPDTDSYRLVRSSAAAHLDPSDFGCGDAVIFDATYQRRLTFRPFSTAAQGVRPGQTQLDEDLISVAGALTARRQRSIT
jgi:FtsK/SpoIIIE family